MFLCRGRFTQRSIFGQHHSRKQPAAQLSSMSYLTNETYWRDAVYAANSLLPKIKYVICLVQVRKHMGRPISLQDIKEATAMKRVPVDYEFLATQKLTLVDFGVLSKDTA